MARHGRNLTAGEKKIISAMTNRTVDPADYLVISEITSTKTHKVLHLRHRVTDEEFEVTIPR